jgi:hypothetical protein
MALYNLDLCGKVSQLLDWTFSEARRLYVTLFKEGILNWTASFWCVVARTFGFVAWSCTDLLSNIVLLINQAPLSICTLPGKCQHTTLPYL